ncbi:hypothetical protein [Clostridium sp. D33t1_170424_F3]|uniref:hypothetical protein n=1 Tax=Clostridium sp. D33t1_170424_F3 TaxID=2787099 RepID=UPI0018AA48E0|nr:hypothetical protein [Clostridium sp. D33t1_170424_F3]
MENSKPTVGEGISPAVGLYFVCFEKQIEILFSCFGKQREIFLIVCAIFIADSLLNKREKTAGCPHAGRHLLFVLPQK